MYKVEIEDDNNDQKEKRNNQKTPILAEVDSISQPNPLPNLNVGQQALFAAGIIPHYTVNVTGHGWRKLMRHPGAFTYRMQMIPPVPPVLSFIQRESGINDFEAYGTFNMGAGFAFFVAAADAKKSLSGLRGAAGNCRSFSINC